MRLVLFVGFEGSGKSTAARFLIDNLGYKNLSFADALKDTVASVFCWPRRLMDGETKKSRVWRETVDPWWAGKLGIPNFTPRVAMRTIGTDVLRKHFNQNLWVFNIERQIQYSTAENIVISDGRFPAELDLVRRLGGQIIRIKRGPEPLWFDLALEANETSWYHSMSRIGVHRSEWAWIGQHMDQTIENDGTVDELWEQVKKCLT